MISANSFVNREMANRERSSARGEEKSEERQLLRVFFFLWNVGLLSPLPSGFFVVYLQNSHARNSYLDMGGAHVLIFRCAMFWFVFFFFGIQGTDD